MWLFSTVLVTFVQLTFAMHNCSFDNGLCHGWTQNHFDDFDWTNWNGSTPSAGTGPSVGLCGHGRYMYLEATRQSNGDNAKLEYSVSSFDIGKLSCLTFYYHMYGVSIDTLNVYNGYTKVFSNSGNRGNEWFQAQINLTLQSKVTFEGIVGNSYTGDIAIDEVSFTDGVCPGCVLNVNDTFGQIDFDKCDNQGQECTWEIQSAGIREAIAMISVWELNFHDCSEYAKITDGNGTEVLYHQGCSRFALEHLLDVDFGLLNKISIQVYKRTESSVKMKFAVLKKGLFPATLVSGWNVTVLDTNINHFTLQWTALKIYTSFYVIVLKRPDGILLVVEMLPSNTTKATLRGLKPSTKYFVEIFGIDSVGRPHKSLGMITTTKEASCGFRPSTIRIVGGTVAPVNSWPWQAMLTDNNGNQFCGGTLVDLYWVVTAAHCISGETPSSVKIRLGAHYREIGRVGTEQDINVANIIMHENYGYPLESSNDIALIKLAKPAVLGEGVGLACMPDIVHPLPYNDVSKKCWITGWGRLSSGGQTPNSLMQVSLPLVSQQRCVNAYPGKVDDSMLCAGLDKGGVDTCQGDSGGPLVCEFNGTWYLEGATSWGHGCAQPLEYGVYAKVRYFKTWIIKNMDNVYSPPAPPQNQTTSSIVWCSFDKGLCPGWNQSSTDDFDWTLNSGSTPSSSTGPSSGHGGSGKYMYIEASSPRKPGENARLVVSVPKGGEKSCISFYYHMYGVSTGTLNVYSWNSKIFSVSGNQSNSWVRVDRNLYLNGVVIFEGITGNSYRGDLAIDQVQITKGSCSVFCDFDDGLCLGWSQSRADVFDWTLHSGSTSSTSTGPSSDHSGSGKYMYIEATGQQTGDNAKLQLAVTKGASTSCLMFYYHMYGSEMGTLNVFSGNFKIFTKTGDQGNYWRQAHRTIHSLDTLTFEGIRGESFTSDIAIDDVTLSNGSCPGCGRVLNKTSGELTLGYSGDNGVCSWKIGSAGIKQAFAILTFRRIYLGYCSEFLTIRRSDGTEVFNQKGCHSSLPNGTSLEVPLGVDKHITVQLFLEYWWSAVKIQYSLIKGGLDSALPISSWNVSVYGITSSSAGVQWSKFPLPLAVSYFLVRYKESSNGVGTLFKGNQLLSAHYTNLLKGFTSYEFQVFAVLKGNGNNTYSSEAVSIKTAEGVPSRAPTNVRVRNRGLHKLLVEWDPLPQQYINGLLLGYRVYYKDTVHLYASNRTVTTSSPHISHVVLENIRTDQRYQISVAGFTSKGPGPKSPAVYITNDCEGFLNQSSGWINFTHTDDNTLNCSVQIGGTDMRQGVVLVSFHYIFFGYCSESLKIYDSNDVQVFNREGCDSIARGLSVEIPFNYGQSIRIAATLSYRHSYARIQYMILNKALSSVQPIPSWNTTVADITSSSLAVKWSKFPIANLPIQLFLVKYKDKTSNVSLIFQAPHWYEFHNSGSVLHVHRLYEVEVIAVTANGGGSKYSSQTQFVRTQGEITSCDFDGGLCSGWKQPVSGVFNWTLHHGSTLSYNTGPSGDHTSGSGYYMYVETSWPRVQGDNAKLEFYVSANRELVCLKFYYHMYGYDMGSLNVFSGNEVVFKASGNHGNYWRKAERDFYLDHNLTFEGIRGSSYTSDIAIDDVSIGEGSCRELTSCDFDAGSLCDNWRQSGSDVFDWTLNTGSTTSSDTGPDGDHTTGSGYYMYIEASGLLRYDDNAKLELSVSGNGELSCLQFYYHMYGDTIGTLNVFSGNLLIFNASGNYGDYWLKARRTIALKNTVTFEGKVGSSFTGDLAIDDISISLGRCQETVPDAISCDFDYGLCYGWRQSHLDDFEWKLGTGSTASPSTGPYAGPYGPYADHTSGSGYYMYIDTSLPRAQGDTARLQLSVSVNKGWYCLKFYYHMYGRDMGSLTVLSGSRMVFQAKGNHGNFWIEATVAIFLGSTAHVKFEGKVGTSFRSDIAIDDVSISSGSCLDQTISTASPTVSTHAASFSSGSPPSQPSTQKPSIPSSHLPGASSTPSTSSPDTSERATFTTGKTTTFSPKTPSITEIQQSVILEVQDLDIGKWTKQNADDFKKEVARVASSYCASDGAKCQLTSISSRRRRSSGNMIFSSDMVHIIDGYPKPSPDNPAIALFGFYLQVPKGFSDKVVNKNVLTAIVKSDEKSIERSIGATIVNVRPLNPITKRPDDGTTDKHSDEESKPTSAIVGATVAGVLLVTVIGVLLVVLRRKKRFCFKRREVRREDYAHFNNAYYIDSAEQDIEMKCDNSNGSSDRVPDQKQDEHHYATLHDLGVNNNGVKIDEVYGDLSTDHSSVYQLLDKKIQAAGDLGDEVVLKFP